MSEYQYYEFCNISKPTTPVARTEMKALSSRSKLTTHGVSYTYNYGDFRGKPKELLAKHFDVFFYISNWGTLTLMFRYPIGEIDINKIKPYLIEDNIEYDATGEHGILTIAISDENNSWGWLEGEGMLADLLPLYDEIKLGNYQSLLLTALINATYNESEQSIIDAMQNSLTPLSSTQRSLLKCIDFPINF